MKREGEHFERILTHGLVIVQHVDKNTFFVGKLLVLLQFVVKLYWIYRVFLTVAFVIAVNLLKMIDMLLTLPGCPHEIYLL